MAEVNTGGGEEKKGKPKKQQLRVDFTPMVDMNMLLITFFMFCTTLSKPQIMNIIVPTKKVTQTEDITKVDKEKTITAILADSNIVYYYAGDPDYTDYTSLHKTDYSPEGFRKYIVSRSGTAISEMYELRKEKQLGKVQDSVFNARAKEIKDKGGIVVLIKPTDAATYENLVDILDEMQICSVKTYAIMDVADGDMFLIDNYRQKGALSAKAPAKPTN